MATLEKRTVAELKRFCKNCGIQGSGKKSDLISAINDGLQEKSMFHRIPISKKHFNIVSIDMGIRNFSYTRLQLDKTLPLNRPPLIKEWTKFDVNNWADVSNDISYEPTKYAHISHRITNEIVFDSSFDPPDLILIERQRIRSSSNKNVLEWVFRVNMFESMLHALIYSRTQNDKIVQDTIIQPSSPQQMAKYWAPSTAEKIKSEDSKRNRLSLVETWLKGYANGPSYNTPFVIPTDLINFSELGTSKSKSKWVFQTVMKNSRFNIEPKDSESAKDVQKGDDLSDSLLHALAWLKWEKQKMILKMELKHSVEEAIRCSDRMYEAHFQEMDRLLGSQKSGSKETNSLEKAPKKTTKKKRKSKKVSAE